LLSELFTTKDETVMRKLKGSLLTTAVAMSLATAGISHAAEPADAIEYRQSAFSVIGWHFGPMGDMAKGDIDYDADEFARRAEAVSALAPLPWEGFIEGSYIGDGHGANTDAKAAIADNPDAFQERVETFTANAATLAEVAQEGDFNASRRAFVKVADACSNCHDDYRQK
jgi:cytochrome c556